MKILLVACDPGGVIGVSGKIPWDLPTDRKLFRQRTWGHAIVMGRATWLSLPKRPLEGRYNVVVSKKTYEPPVNQWGPFFFVNLPQALPFSPDIFVIGGESIYQEALPWVGEIICSQVRQRFSGDRHFHIDLKVWKEVERIPYSKFDVVHYRRRDPMDDLRSTTDMENLSVGNVHVNPPGKIGTTEFSTAVTDTLSQGKIWRTSKALAHKLQVDVVDLDNFLRKQKTVASRVGQEEGIFLYALISRLDNHEQTIIPRLLVTEEDRYALASLHSALLLLSATLTKYALKIHERHAEAFSSIVQAKEKLEGGTLLFAQKLKADINKLPK